MLNQHYNKYLRYKSFDSNGHNLMKLTESCNRLGESITSKDSLLQNLQQEHEVTKKSIKALQEDNGALVLKNKEANKITDQLQEDIKRFEAKNRCY
jgi:peptidoglycan hydrolase CwlO-like protein